MSSPDSSLDLLTGRNKFGRWYDKKKALTKQAVIDEYGVGAIADYMHIGSIKGEKGLVVKVPLNKMDDFMEKLKLIDRD